MIHFDQFRRQMNHSSLKRYKSAIQLNWFYYFKIILSKQNDFKSHDSRFYVNLFAVAKKITRITEWWGFYLSFEVQFVFAWKINKQKLYNVTRWHYSSLSIQQVLGKATLFILSSCTCSLEFVNLHLTEKFPVNIGLKKISKQNWFA